MAKAVFFQFFLCSILANGDQINQGQCSATDGSCGSDPTTLIQSRVHLQLDAQHTESQAPSPSPSPHGSPTPAGQDGGCPGSCASFAADSGWQAVCADADSPCKSCEQCKAAGGGGGAAGGGGNATGKPTCGGDARNAPCSFPFTYHGVTYTECTTHDSGDHGKPWCFTDAQQHWGTCECPAQPTEPVPAGDLELTAYWDYGNCGIKGDDHNWDWCEKQGFKCKQEVVTNHCTSGKAVLVSSHGSSTLPSVRIGDCDYAYYAQYKCSGGGEPQAETTCKTKRQLATYDEAGSCEGRCATQLGYRCCPENNRCVKEDMPCNKPPKTCDGTCSTGWNCCIAQGNQCLKHPIPNKADLCECLAEASTEAPTTPPTESSVCQDTPGWKNYKGNGCDKYAAKGWCVNGGFAAGSEWTGSPTFKREDFPKSDKCYKRGQSADECYNYPADNCCVCGKGNSQAR